MSCCKTKFAETGSMPRRNEIIYLLGIDKEDMVEVREKMEKRFEDGKTVPGTKSSPHFISQSASQIDTNCNEDESFVNIHDFKIPT